MLWYEIHSKGHAAEKMVKCSKLILRSGIFPEEQMASLKRLLTFKFQGG